MNDALASLHFLYSDRVGPMKRYAGRTVFLKDFIAWVERENLKKIEFRHKHFSTRTLL